MNVAVTYHELSMTVLSILSENFDNLIVSLDAVVDDKKLTM